MPTHSLDPVSEKHDHDGKQHIKKYQMAAEKSIPVFTISNASLIILPLQMKTSLFLNIS